LQIEANSEYSALKVTLFLIIGVTTFGFSPIIVRYATDIEPLALAAMRTSMAVLILLPFWYQKKTPIKNLKKYGVNMGLIAGAGFALGLHFTFWIASLHYTSVASASVLVGIHPIMLIIAESMIFKAKFRPLVWSGVFIAFGGSVMLGIADDVNMELFPDALLGNTLAFTAAVIFVVYFLLGRKIRQHTEWIDYVFHVYLHAAIVCTILTFIWVGGFPVISGTGVLAGIALAIGPTILGHGSMNYAVKYVSPTLLSTLVLSEAAFAAVAAYFIFNEIPSMLSITAMVVIITGVILTWTRRFK